MRTVPAGHESLLMLQPVHGFRSDWDGPDSEVRFHAERQDSSAPGWLRLLELVDEAATDGRETFAPMRVLTPEQRRQIVTLPATIARLTSVTELIVYRARGLMEIVGRLDDVRSAGMRCPAYRSGAGGSAWSYVCEQAGTKVTNDRADPWADG